MLELGAGAGLPSLVCAARGARTVSGYLRGYVEGHVLTKGQVVVTDYPDAALIENLRFNIASCGLLPEGCEIHAEVRRIRLSPGRSR